MRAPLALLSLLVLGACRGEPSREPPMVPIRNMYRQPKLTAQAASDFFADGRAMREPPEGTVARETFEEDVELDTGRTRDGTYVALLPAVAVERAGGMAALLSRGRERYDIYCAPCHDRAGTGAGTVVQRGFQRPPSLHDERVRRLPDGQLYLTITNGVRSMPAYANVPLADRWAIVGYLRALQSSQLAAAPATTGGSR